MQSFHTLPDDIGHFGPYGGRFVPETLMSALEELETAYRAARSDETFQAELETLSQHYVGRPTPLYHAKNLSRELGGANIYLKREDLAHTGAHKINNALGQGLLAKRMGKNRVIAETGAGQHGVAAATVCAMLNQECIVYMGEEDIRRQSLNVFRMRLLGGRGPSCQCREPHVEGRHQRMYPGLGHQCGDYALSHRERCGTPSLPDDGPRLPVCAGARGAGANAGRHGDASPTMRSPVWVAAATLSGYSTASYRTVKSSWSAWRPEALVSRVESTPQHW